MRLIMAGSAIIFAGFVVGGISGSNYAQFAIQASQFDECFDYSSGSAIKVKCADKTQDQYLYLGLSLALLGIGGIVLVKGIRGKWDQNVKSDEMVGPKR